MTKEIILAEISTQDYIRKFRDIDKFIEFCKDCKNYNSVWTCPPFDSRSYKCIDAFSLTTIIGVKINIDQKLRNQANSAEERDALIRKILLEVRREFDAQLLSMEQQITPSLLYCAGSCRLCAQGECKRLKGEKCRYPDKMRSTLEAIGFDMGRTTSELLGVEMKWCNGNELPPYFTLVYGLLTNGSVGDKLKNALENIKDVTSVNER